MSEPKDSTSFFRKVVKFVANPTTEWADVGLPQDETRENEFAKSELKAMIERKRRNDFVRKREFDMLRKVRREGLSGEQLAALGGSSRIDDSDGKLLVAESGAKQEAGVLAARAVLHKAQSPGLVRKQGECAVRLHGSHLAQPGLQGRVQRQSLVRSAGEGTTQGDHLPRRREFLDADGRRVGSAAEAKRPYRWTGDYGIPATLQRLGWDAAGTASVGAGPAHAQEDASALGVRKELRISGDAGACPGQPALEDLGDLAAYSPEAVDRFQALAAELGDDGRGVAVSQVVPFPWNVGTPVVKDYQKHVAGANATAADYNFGSLEGYIAAKIFVEGLRRAGKEPTRESFVNALESLREFDVGGFYVTYTPSDHNGSKFVDLTVIGKEGRILR